MRKRPRAIARRLFQDASGGKTRKESAVNLIISGQARTKLWPESNSCSTVKDRSTTGHVFLGEEEKGFRRRRLCAGHHGDGSLSVDGRRRWLWNIKGGKSFDKYQVHGKEAIFERFIISSFKAGVLRHKLLAPPPTPPSLCW